MKNLIIANLIFWVLGVILIELSFLYLGVSIKFTSILIAASVYPIYHFLTNYKKV